MNDEKKLTWKDVEVGHIFQAQEGLVFWLASHANYYCSNGASYTMIDMEAELSHQSGNVRILSEMQPEWLNFQHGLMTGFTVPDEVLNPKEEADPQPQPATDFKPGDWFWDSDHDSPLLKMGDGAIRCCGDKTYIISDKVLEIAGQVGGHFVNCAPVDEDFKPPIHILTDEELDIIKHESYVAGEVETLKEIKNGVYDLNGIVCVTDEELSELKKQAQPSQAVQELVCHLTEPTRYGNKTIPEHIDEALNILAGQCLRDYIEAVQTEIKAADGVDEKVGNETDFVTKVRALLYALRDSQAVEVLRMHSDFHDYAHLFNAFQNLQAKMDAADSAIKESLIAQETNGVATHVEGKDKPVCPKQVGQCGEGDSV